ncbi:MAG: tRNA 2-thiouridine(34) synthase MnmA [Candidatus Eisenbacteria bacterium]|uniref:tRNA-specific 2-thiouridylase MnmA n=1 Tax=Eiseniibacteriota bacterium TaxID=2212470 RepID=A0A538SPF9_UNCEI|nr:MAG: tRNA 2-thiouridine(34) synthase MnmA [Candidatus Eisenbacteria bacterium]
MTRLKVLAAMSGGVDSAVAAALLAEQGHDVTGVTLKLWCYGRSPLSPRACCTLEAIDDARVVARRMGFPHFVIEAEEVFRARVLQPFLDAYASGRTPYPCALCNQSLKFGDLVSRMELVGADVLATGHYARVQQLAGGSHGLLRAADRSKDQSYALALVPYSVLPRVVFPLGALAKSEVRAHGERLGLAVWHKPESQDLCFVPDGDYAGFMVKNLGETRGLEPGPILSIDGRRLGTHRGVIHYTVGQRRGLGLAAPEPLYVIEIDAERNAVVVGPRSALEVPGLVTETANWLMPEPPPEGMRVEAKIRYQHAPAGARILPLDGGRVEVRFETPQPAVTPGQLAVFYDGDRVLGGATIARALATGRSAPHAVGLVPGPAASVRVSGAPQTLDAAPSPATS